MAVEVGFAERNPYSRSLVERIRMSKDTQWRRLLIWTVVLVSAALAVGLSQPHFIPSKTLMAVLSALAGGAGFGAAVYCLAIFVLERKVATLFAAVAFSALGSGSVLQAVIDFSRTTYAVSDWIAGASWLVAGVLLLGQAHSQTKLRAASRVQSLQQLVLAGAAVAAFPLSVMPYALTGTAYGRFASSVFEAAAAHSMDNVISLAAGLLLAGAISANHRRYMTQNDGLAGLLCYFLSAAAAGLLFAAFSSQRFDSLATVSLVCIAASWLALVSGNGVENAFAHKEAGDRLEELETLHDVSWSLVGAGTVSELLDLFVSTLVSKMGAKIAAVYLSDGPDKLKLAAISGNNEADVGHVYPLISERPYPGFHTGHTARAYASRQVQIANDVFVDVEFVPWKVIAQDDGCAASIPLMDQEHCIGVLDVYFPDSRQLSATRLRLLATIAASGTSAVQFALARQTEDEQRKAA